MNADGLEDLPDVLRIKKTGAGRESEKQLTERIDTLSFIQGDTLLWLYTHIKCCMEMHTCVCWTYWNFLSRSFV